MALRPVYTHNYYPPKYIDQKRVPKDSLPYFISRRDSFIKAFEPNEPQTLADWAYWETDKKVDGVIDEEHGINAS